MQLAPKIRASSLAAFRSPNEEQHGPSTPVLLTAIWTLLALGPWLAAGLGRESATLVVFSICVGLALSTQQHRLHRAGRDGGKGLLACCWMSIAGIAAGWGLAPGFAWGLLHLGSLLGLEAMQPVGSNWPIRVANLFLAPVFEEILYRGRLLGWLRARTGPLTAILLSSLAFSVPHSGSWSQLTTFIVGLGLATVHRASGSLLLCVALHAGLNLASEIALAGATSWLVRPEFSLWLALPTTAALVARLHASRRTKT